MEFFSHKTKINFMGARKVTAVFSILVSLASIIVLCINGLHLGLDFTGGTEYKLSYPQAADLSQMRVQLSNAHFPQAVVQAFGDTHTVLVRLGEAGDLTQEALTTQIKEALPDAQLMSVEYIGPQVGKELFINGALALLVALLGTAVYIALRFEYRFAVSAVVSLIHDPLIILGVFSLFHIEFDLIALASVLTVIGYSLNDTVVVFDRVRENFRKMRTLTPVEIVNASVNETLSRTLMTSFLTMLAVLALFFVGGNVVHGFSIAMIIGIVIGTYSSIYVAGALALALGLSRQDLIPPPKTAYDERP
ncbi:MAG: secF [Gammaproteobacteria bacterium]|jgi:preprotein translocase subunit SecF|nr:secF [Gammaproteobacteria bacterium]